MNLQDILKGDPIPLPMKSEDYLEYLSRMDVLGKGFNYTELVKTWGVRRFRKPPHTLWPRMVKTLLVANDFRDRCRHAGAASGCKVAAAYRPIGGSTGSQHKRNAALDLDHIGGDGKLYFIEAVRMWCQIGRELDMGLGLYTWSSKSTGGIRVHIDTGYRCRSWQGIRSGFGRPWSVNGKRVGLAEKLAVDIGLRPPTWEPLPCGVL